MTDDSSVGAARADVGRPAKRRTNAKTNMMILEKRCGAIEFLPDKGTESYTLKAELIRQQEFNFVSGGLAVVITFVMVDP